jgi:pyruvate/2-oxoglutarate dehydrogenase complex dihydrolipoamide acyltransferase (E2) component
MTDILVPRLNANDDELLLVDVRVSNGVTVAEGDVLFVVESMKASSEILSPSAGVIVHVSVKKGEMASVGKLMCEVAEPSLSEKPVASGPSSQGVSTAEKVKITAKASQRARELGVDITQVVPCNDRIGLEEVEAFAAKAAVPAGSR